MDPDGSLVSHRSRTLLLFGLFGCADRSMPSQRLYGKFDMGETRSLTGVYKLLASLRRLAAWVELEFKDWFSRLTVSSPSSGSWLALQPPTASAAGHCRS